MRVYLWPCDQKGGCFWAHSTGFVSVIRADALAPGDHRQGLGGLTASSHCASLCAARLHSPWIHATGEWARGADQSAAASAHRRTPLRPPRLALPASLPCRLRLLLPASVLPRVPGGSPSLCSEGLPPTPALSSFALPSCHSENPVYISCLFLREPKQSLPEGTFLLQWNHQYLLLILIHPERAIK